MCLRWWITASVHKLNSTGPHKSLIAKKSVILRKTKLYEQSFSETGKNKRSVFSEKEDLKILNGISGKFAVFTSYVLLETTFNQIWTNIYPYDVIPHHESNTLIKLYFSNTIQFRVYGNEN